MLDIEKTYSELQERRPVCAAILCFLFVLILLFVLGWFLLFSGLNTSADFIYNQF